MKTVAVVMAGGRGERFWPKSRQDLPKQFLSLTGDGVTMIEHTVIRLAPMIAPDDVFIVTNEAYKGLVREQLPAIPIENILTEPVAKNTAPCIAFAAAVIGKRYGDAVMAVLPSDHLIKNNILFLETLQDAREVALEGDNLVTMGIVPTYPETGYGYIRFRPEDSGAGRAHRVEQFVEKPDLAAAKQYLATGEYLWNSGMFVWKASAILSCFSRYLPDIYEGALRIARADGTPAYGRTLKEEFDRFEPVSIDYGVMEKAPDIYTLPGNFGWDDVGSWLALERCNPTDDAGNVVQGDIVAFDCERSILVGGKKLIAAVGLEDIVVVDAGDATLVCHRDHAQKIKQVLERLRRQNRTDVL